MLPGFTLPSLMNVQRHVQRSSVPATRSNDRRAGVASALPHTKAQVLAAADRPELGKLAVVDEQRDPRVAEPERREPAELLAERQTELGTGDDRIDGDDDADRLHPGTGRRLHGHHLLPFAQRAFR